MHVRASASVRLIALGEGGQIGAGGGLSGRPGRSMLHRAAARPTPTKAVKIVLRSDRTLLRPLSPDDAVRQNAFDQDMELSILDCRPPVPVRQDQTDDFVQQRHEDQRDVARMAIEVDQVYIGHCSLSGLRQPHGSLELGILIGDREYWSRGLGREVVRALLSYGFQALAARRIGLTTHEDNPRAISCYQACGFVEEGRPRQAFWTGRHYADLVEMSILRDEWAAASVDPHMVE